MCRVSNVFKEVFVVTLRVGFLVIYMLGGEECCKQGQSVYDVLCYQVLDASLYCYLLYCVINYVVR